jgi:hypothetical protein
MRGKARAADLVVLQDALRIADLELGDRSALIPHDVDHAIGGVGRTVHQQARYQQASQQIRDVHGCILSGLGWCRLLSERGSRCDVRMLDSRATGLLNAFAQVLDNVAM